MRRGRQSSVDDDNEMMLSVAMLVHAFHAFQALRSTVANCCIQSARPVRQSSPGFPGALSQDRQYSARSTRFGRAVVL